MEYSIALDIKAEAYGGEVFEAEVQNGASGSHVRRARFHSSMIDSRMLGENDEFSSLKDSYVIFIYKKDKFRKGLPVYHVTRQVEETGRRFGDGSHIIYVNGRYNGNDELGKLIHDFKCRTSSEVYNKALADGIRYYKETEEGRDEMSEAVKKYGNKREKRGIKHARINDVKSMKVTMSLTIEQALDALMINGKERESILKALQN